MSPECTSRMMCLQTDFLRIERKCANICHSVSGSCFGRGPGKHPMRSLSNNHLVLSSAMHDFDCLPPERCSLQIAEPLAGPLLIISNHFVCPPCLKNDVASRRLSFSFVCFFILSVNLASRKMLPPVCRASSGILVNVLNV